MSDRETPPQLGLKLYDTLPEDFDAGLLEPLTSDGLSIRTLRIPGGPFAGIELYLPAVAMLFVGRAYFEGFLTKAGEDHYALLKSAATKLWTRASVLRVTSIGTAGKVSSNGFSLTYAIMGEVAPGLTFKFILQAKVDQAEAGAGIRAFMDLLLAFQSDRLSATDTEALLTYRPVGGTILVTFDPQTKRIVPVDAFGSQTTSN